MKALLTVLFIIAVVGGGLKLAGVRLPLIDYPIGPIGVDTPGPAMPDIQIEAPGFGEFPVP
ncbi:MAG: hypothetical protein K5924_12410 [Chloroflexi bacterium]|nr:hypothetical protein [Chloroflexota bacterium]